MENITTYKAKISEPHISPALVQNFQGQFGCGRIALCQEICKLKGISYKTFHLSDFDLNSTSLSEIEDQINLLAKEDAVILDGIDSVNERDLPLISSLILKWSLSRLTFLVSFPNSDKMRLLVGHCKITLL